MRTLSDIPLQPVRCNRSPQNHGHSFWLFGDLSTAIWGKYRPQTTINIVGKWSARTVETRPSAARPGLFDELREIVCPILARNSARIDDVRQIVVGVRKNKIRVTDGVVHARTGTRCLTCWRYAGRLLRGFYVGFATCEADKPFVETIEPRAKCLGVIPRRISRHEDELHLIAETGGQLLKAPRDIRHVERAFIGTLCISEKEKRHIALGLRPEIKRGSRCIGQRKSWFR